MADVVLPQTKNIEKLAVEIIEKSEKKAQNLPEDFIIKHSSWIMLSHFDKDEVGFLRSESQGNLERVASFLPLLASKILLIEKLRDRTLFFN